MTPTLDRHLDVQSALRRHLASAVPTADIRSWLVDGHGIRIHVGPEVGLWSDVEVRPEVRRVALAVDPFLSLEAYQPVHHGSYWTFRWVCQWNGVRVVVQGEGQGDRVQAPAPLPEPKAVAA